jgi:hypothetical protein
MQAFEVRGKIDQHGQVLLARLYPFFKTLDGQRLWAVRFSLDFS